MQIDRIHYGELRSIGNFSNRKIEAEAVLCEGEDPRASLGELTNFVRAEFGLFESISSLEDRRKRLEQEVSDLAYRVDTDSAVVAELRAVISKLKNEREELRCDICDKLIPAGKLVHTGEGDYCSEGCAARDSHETDDFDDSDEFEEDGVQYDSPL